MDIYEILKSENDSLSFDELKYLEDELLIGHYNVTYVGKCYDLIKQIKDSKKNKESRKYRVTRQTLQGLLISSSDLNIYEETESLTLEETIIKNLETFRGTKEFKTKLENMIKTLEINEEVIEKIYKEFRKSELDIFVKNIQFSEMFLEKYIDDLDIEGISKYQLFSEEFFQKHYQKFNADYVIKHSKNEWVKKGNMSKKLEIFLKLKGVKL